MGNIAEISALEAQREAARAMGETAQKTATEQLNAITDRIDILRRQRIEEARAAFRCDPDRAAARERLRLFEERASFLQHRAEVVTKRRTELHRARGRAALFGEDTSTFLPEVASLREEDELLADVAAVYRVLRDELEQAVRDADTRAGKSHGYFEEENNIRTVGL